MTSNSISRAVNDIQVICDKSKGRSQFFIYGTNGYKDSVRHWFDSSSEVAEAAVQPGSVEDLSAIIKVLAATKAPFAIKGGGHATSPNMSSTRGIQIYMSRFDTVRYDSKKQTLDVGAGCLWDQVYREIFKYKRNVVGGASAQGVGVAGYLLGGGYSLKTNQYGLGIDNIAGFQVVLPDGNVVEVGENNKSRSDLFEALKGGGNNFGIVTRFTLKTHSQSVTYGAGLTFNDKQAKKVKAAIVDFARNEKRPQAAIVAAFRHAVEQGQVNYSITVRCVFDGKKPSQDPFNKFRAINRQGWGPDGAGWGRGIDSDEIDSSDDEIIESRAIDVADEGGFREMPYTELDNIVSDPYAFPHADNGDNDTLASGVRGLEIDDEDAATRGLTSRAAAPKKAAMSGVGEITARGRFACIMVSKYTKKLVDAVADEAKNSAGKLTKNRGRMVLIDVWPFLPSIFDKSPPAAWPHAAGQVFGPLLAYFLWESEKDDKFWLAEMKRALEAIRKVALAEGCTVEGAPVYLNTSLESTAVRDIYRGNLSKLSKTRAKYDPKDVMGNAGGFRIPLPRKKSSRGINDTDVASDSEEGDS